MRFILNSFYKKMSVLEMKMEDWQKGPIYSFLYFGYPIILLINIIAIVSESLFYVNLAIILTFIMYLISKINYANHVGEFWCYFSNSVPLLVLITQKILG